MAAYDLEEQEQLSELKVWWQQYGSLVTAVVAVAAVTVVAYQAWNWYQRSQAAEASALYAVVQKAAAENDAKKSREAAGALLEKYSGTAYAAMAALLSAKVQFETGDLKTAKAQLAWAAENAREDEMRDLARLRLANALSDEKAYDEALKQLEKAPLAPYAARYAELKGDILAAQDKRAEARRAYQAALAKLDEVQKDARQHATPYRELLQLKLEALGESP